MDLRTYYGDCIVFNGTSGVNFNCNSRKIEGEQTGAGSAGILFTNSAQGNSASNCREVSDFNYGVKFENANNNRVSGMMLKWNANGVNIYSGSGNTVEDSVSKYNIWGAYVQNTASNAFTDVGFIQNAGGMSLYYGSSSQINGVRALKNKNAGISLSLGSNTNTITDSYIADNGEGMLVKGWSNIWPSGNQIYDNYLRNAPNFNSTTSAANSLSVPQDCNLKNVMGCSCIGGNYWSNPTGNGMSDTCARSGSFCTGTYTPPYTGTAITDSKPIASGVCCDVPDRDGDGYYSASCGGNDCDDDPSKCGPDCHPGGAESCDGYDNDCDSQADESACSVPDSVNILDAKYPTIVYRHSCASSGSRIYCFGGNTRAGSGGTESDAVIEIDPAADTARYLSARLPATVSSVSCATDTGTGRIYCFGGEGQDFTCTTWNGADCIVGTVTVGSSNDITEFNPQSGALTLKRDMPSPILVSCAEDSSTHRIYCFGTSVYEYIPASNIINTRTAVPAAAIAEFLSCAEGANHRIYCFGGKNVLEYNPATDTLITKSPRFTRNMKYHSCATAGSDIYCFGGYTMLTGSKIHYMNEIYKYTPSTDTLLEMDAKLPWGRDELACAGLSGKIYCSGGGTNVVDQDQIFEYVPGPGGIAVCPDSNDDGMQDAGC